MFVNDRTPVVLPPFADLTLSAREHHLDDIAQRINVCDFTHERTGATRVALKRQLNETIARIS
jgi:hypothetical protein